MWLGNFGGFMNMQKFQIESRFFFLTFKKSLLCNYTTAKNETQYPKKSVQLEKFISPFF